MEINFIREKLADKLGSTEVYDVWVDILQDTNPGNYGVEDIEINVDVNDIWVDIPERTFNFKILYVLSCFNYNATGDLLVHIK